MEVHHSTSGLARELMPEEESDEFRAAVVEALRPWTVEGWVELPVSAMESWGRPSGR